MLFTGGTAPAEVEMLGEGDVIFPESVVSEIVRKVDGDGILNGMGGNSS